MMVFSTKQGVYTHHSALTTDDPCYYFGCIYFFIWLVWSDYHTLRRSGPFLPISATMRMKVKQLTFIEAYSGLGHTMTSVGPSSKRKILYFMTAFAQR